MPYDFTAIPDRAGKDAIAVDSLGKGGAAPDRPKEGFSPIPMWVADMNFPTAPAVTEAIAARLTHPYFGYFEYRQEYYDAIIRWQTERNHAVGLTPDCIGYENGVIGGVINALNQMIGHGDPVLIHAPTYTGFTGSLTANGNKIISSPLVRDEKGIWRMDFEDMEARIREYGIRAVVFCSPHNPTGRVWEKWELEKAMALFEKYDMGVVSDEIWSDLILGEGQHIPTQSVSEWARMHTAAMYAPSKTFNLAGLVCSYHIVYSEELRSRMRGASGKTFYNNMNVLSMHGLIGAYSREGEAWLTELRQVLTDNTDFACRYIREHFDGVDCMVSQGTYMLFVDCTGWCEAHGKTIEDVEKAAWAVGVGVQDGRMFHGPCHLRMNLALPKSMLADALDRLNRYVFHA